MTLTFFLGPLTWNRPDGKTYKGANNACVNFFLALLKFVPNFALFCHESELYCRFALFGKILVDKKKSITIFIMQGTSFGSIFYASVLDKLSQIVYSGSKLLYKYKGEVEVPILGMANSLILKLFLVDILLSVL